LFGGEIDQEQRDVQPAAEPCVHEPLERARGRECVQAGVAGAASCGPRRAGPSRPLDAIKGTTEPNRAAQFDEDFRPSKLTRRRWQSVWLAFHRGATLPPISVVQVGDAYAIRDGHHRVSVAKALGAPSIPAIVAA
jgi:ParB/Sulfiredoxin domain